MGYLTDRTLISGITKNDFIHVVNPNDLSQGNPAGSSYKGNLQQVSDLLSEDFVNISGDTMTGTLNVPIISATTISATTFYGDGSNLTGIVASFSGGSGACVADLYVTNIHGCSPITVYDSIQSNGSTGSGLNTIAIGLNNLASGNYSHAFGKQTIASGSGSHSEGDTTTASGYYSHSEGSFTTASGNYSHAEGRNTTASGSYSHSEGYQTLASSIGAHAEGGQTTASGDYSHAEGYQTSAITSFTHSEGYQTLASGIGAHSKGRQTIASGNYSSASGYLTNASGLYSNAFGYNTTASGLNSFTKGFQTSATGTGSSASGYNTAANGIYSTTIGADTTASGDYSHAEGVTTRAIGVGSHSEGLYTIANGYYQHVQGQYNLTSTTQSAFIIGNGTSPSNRSNLIFAAGNEFNIYGNLTITGGTTGSTLNLSSIPTLNNSNTQILSRNSSTGNIEYTSLSSITTSVQTYKTIILTGGTSYTFTDYNTVNTLSINKSTGSTTTVILNQTPTLNEFYVVKDRKGDSNIYPIIVSGGTYNIDGNSTVTINLSKTSLTFLFDGEEYIII